MKLKTRWIAGIIEEAEKTRVPLPFERQWRSQAWKTEEQDDEVIAVAGGR